MAKNDRLAHSKMAWRMKFNNQQLGENVIQTEGIQLDGIDILPFYIFKII